MRAPASAWVARWLIKPRWAELLVYATLRKQGYTVEVHPACGHPSRKPDFLAKDDTGAAVYNGIDRVKLPAGCRLGIEILKHGRLSDLLPADELDAMAIAVRPLTRWSASV